MSTPNVFVSDGVPQQDLLWFVTRKSQDQGDGSKAWCSPHVAVWRIRASGAESATTATLVAPLANPSSHQRAVSDGNHPNLSFLRRRLANPHQPVVCDCSRPGGTTTPVSVRGTKGRSARCEVAVFRPRRKYRSREPSKSVASSCCRWRIFDTLCSTDTHSTTQSRRKVREVTRGRLGEMGDEGPKAEMMWRQGCTRGGASG